MPPKDVSAELTCVAVKEFLFELESESTLVTLRVKSDRRQVASDPPQMLERRAALQPSYARKPASK